MATARRVEPLAVHIVPMRRRHLRSVLGIETQVYPRPWTMSLFLSELGLRGTRAYYVAKVGRDVVGYAGLMVTVDEGHITTIAVDPAWHRHQYFVPFCGEKRSNATPVWLVPSGTFMTESSTSANSESPASQKL